MDFPELVKKKHVSEIDYFNEKIKLFFEDGTKMSYSFNEWFQFLELANQFIITNDELLKNCEQKKII